MRNRLAALLLLAAVASGPNAFGQVPPPKPTPPPPMTVSMQGTIERYDAATQTVTLSTSKGAVKFVLAPLVRLRRDGKVVAASSFQTLAGCRAVVRYSEFEGIKTVESVHVFGKTKR